MNGALSTPLRKICLSTVVVLAGVFGAAAGSSHADFPGVGSNLAWWTDSNYRACQRAEIHHGPPDEARYGRTLAWMTSPASCTGTKTAAFLTARVAFVNTEWGVTCKSEEMDWEWKTNGLANLGVAPEPGDYMNPWICGPGDEYAIASVSGACIWTVCRHTATQCPPGAPFSCTAQNLYPSYSPFHPLPLF